MEYTDVIIQLISNVGFPIATCVACFWYINKQSEQHKKEMDSVTDAINNNTIALTKLMDKIGEEN